MHPEVPSVGADEDAATIFRAAKKNIQPANRISFNENNLNKTRQLSYQRFRPILTRRWWREHRMSHRPKSR